MNARSYLYVPGDRPDRLAKALDRAGDALIADLEDGVPVSRRAAARETVAGWLRSLTAPRPEIWVRLSGFATLADDVAAVVAPALHGVVLPKADVPAVIEADRLIAQAETAAGLTPGSVRLAPLVESARGWLEVTGLAACPRVTHLAIGEADLTADLGLMPQGDTDPMLMPLRLQLVAASAAAGLASPTGPVDTAVRDLGRLTATSRELRRMGFGARSAIHPDQVPVIEAAFTPDADEVERARTLVSAYDGGTGVDSAGRFIDEAVLRSARRVVALADRLGL